MTVPVSRFDFLARLKRSVQLTADLGDTLRLLADELMRRLSADRVLIAVRQSDRARAFLWSVERAEMGGPALLERSELSSVDAGQYLFEAPPSWVAIRRPAPLDDVVILK